MAKLTEEEIVKLKEIVQERVVSAHVQNAVKTKLLKVVSFAITLSKFIAATGILFAFFKNFS